MEMTQVGDKSTSPQQTFIGPKSTPEQCLNFIQT